MSITDDPVTGAYIIGDLLRADNDFVANVPAERIKLGAVPSGTPLPLVLIRTISSVERQSLRRGGTTRTTDRVSITVRVEHYRDLASLIRLIKNCCAGRTGNIGNGQSVAILTAGTGPDLIGPGNSFEQAQDFRVSHDA